MSCTLPFLRRWAACWFAALLLVSAPATAAEPRDVVERFHAALLDVMQNADKLGISGRYDRLRPEVERAFDLSRMIRIASGPAWTDADETARKSLVEAFARMSAGTYAAQFDGYSGESFAIDGVKPGPRGSRLVATRIVTGKGESVPITYVLIDSDTPDDWQITDVLLNNAISELSVRRSEYRSIVEKSGLPGLAKTLDDKASELLAP